MNDTRKITVEYMVGAPPELLPVYRIWQTIDCAGIERTRNIGIVMYHSAPQFIASVNYDETVRITIGTSPSLPGAIDILNAFHEQTHHQYAPWPAMDEEDEE